MPGKIIIDKVDMVNAPNAPINTYVMAFDIDGILKKKDEFGVITPIGYAGANASIVWSNVLWVTENPSSTPGMGDLGHPFSLDAAILAALPGQTIIIVAGTYTITENLAKDGVRITTIGKVDITRSVAGPIIDINSTFTYPVLIDGDFTFLRNTSATEPFVARITSTNVTVKLKFYKATSVVGDCIYITSANLLVEITGDITSTTNNRCIVCDTGCDVIYNGSISTTSTTSPAVFLGGSGQYCKIIINGRINAPDVSTATCIKTTSFDTISVTGILNAGFSGLAIDCSSSGGSVTLNGTIYGAIKSTTIAPNISRVDQIVATGWVHNVIASGNTSIIIHGGVTGTIQVTDAAAEVILYGDFRGGIGTLFNVSAGVLDVHGNSKRLFLAAYSVVSGGKVMWRGDMSHAVGTVPGDGDTRALVVVSGGELHLLNGSLIQNTLNDIYGNAIRLTGGKVIMDGGKIKVTGSSALCILCTATGRTVQVLKGLVNRDIFTNRPEKIVFTVLSPVGAVGGIHSIAIPGGATASHTVVGGDTVTTIRNALLSALSGHAGLASSSSVSTDSIEVVGATAGLNIAPTVGATGVGSAGISGLVTQDSHSAPTDEITASITPTTGWYLVSSVI